jgi:signal transduction histidine kinase
MLLGLVAGLEIDLVVGVLRLFFAWPPHAWIVVAAATVGLPVGLAVSAPATARRHSGRLVTSAVAALILTALVVVVYVVVVVGFDRAPRHGERLIVLLTLVAGAIVAAIWQPARRRCQVVARRLLQEHRLGSRRPLGVFGERLSRAIPMEELLLQLAESLRESLRLSSVEVWSGTRELLRRTVAIPHREPVELALTPDESSVVARAGVSGPAWAAVWLPSVIGGREDAQLRVAPLVHADQLMGLLVVERDPAEQPFSQAEEEELAELGRRAGLALHNVVLDSALQASLEDLREQAEQLRESRNRVVLAGDAERRRLERDLHDGAQQRLVGLNIKLGLLRRLYEQQPAEVARLIDELGNELHEALDELRDLAHGIYPPLLRDSGLAVALAAAARRSSVATEIDANGIGRFEPDTEAAVYFCCLEALQNAAKYAGDGTRTQVRIWEEEGALLFEVADDGAGFQPERLRKGAGLANMEDRLGALGGSLRVGSEPGQGTRVGGRIPIARTG